MATNHKIKQYGKLIAIIYDLEFVGDGLPTHSHHGDSHITICARGSVKVITPKWEVVLTPGDIIDFPDFQPHSITALEDNTRIINMPKDHIGLPQDDE